MSTTWPRVPVRFRPEEYRRRPRNRDEDVIELILDRISNGELLAEICTEDQDMPLPGTFLRWTEEDPELEKRYVAAMRRGTDVHFDDALSAAFDSDSFRGGLRHRALITRAERLNPDKYGTRATVRQTTPEEDAGGVDHAAEVRRRLASMADRLAGSSAPKT